ncbi:Protein ALP1-like [Holothuria leucospilota]|uniref:Protein ALP1-like n=1 Tax=Holothuria leucospilota TaxID=206669 RepID=A0A9Q1HG92_HOLLE|nr:Protein ALP1-like [Holothuria leucospilota]
MMALVDSDYKFLYVDVGANGRISDGGVFKECSLEQALERRSANIPPPTPFPGDERPVNHFIVGDEAFPLKDYLLKPYPHRNLDVPQRIFNYRLSRARRVVENAFGILANRFRVFQTNIALEPAKVEKLVLASCALHNFLRVEAGNSYLNTMVDKEDFQTHDLIPGSWRSDPQLSNAALFRNQNYNNRAKQLRDYVCAYVNSQTGSVPWQWDMI